MHVVQLVYAREPYPGAPSVEFSNTPSIRLRCTLYPMRYVLCAIAYSVYRRCTHTTGAGTCKLSLGIFFTKPVELRRVSATVPE